MMLCRVAWMAVIVLLSGTAARADETLDEVARQLDDVVRQYKTIRYKSEMTSEMTYNDQVVRGRQEMDHEVLRLPDGRALSRYETRSKVQRRDDGRHGQPAKPDIVEESYALSIFDGQYLYDLRQGAKRVFAVKTQPARNPYDPVGRLQQSRDQFDIRLLPERTFEGKEVYAIEFLTRESDANAVVRRLVCYTDRKTGLPIKTISYDKEGRVVNTTTVVESHVNEEIPADHFVFYAPPGVEVVDRTAPASAPTSRMRPAAPVQAHGQPAARPRSSGPAAATSAPVTGGR